MSLQKTGTVLVLVWCTFFIHAQDFNRFVTLKSRGDIPADFTTLSTDKYKTDQAENSDKSLDENFFLSTRFFIDELLLGGQVLFNDPLTVYLNKVANYVLKDDKELLGKLRFYVLKTNTPNAFSTDQGVILFTTGLLAQLENEAQLAYIICHEVSHFTEKHVRNSYVESKNIRSGKGQYRRLSQNARIKQMSVYSKDSELDADKKGVDIFLKSEYDIEEIFGGFEVLLYSYLPFDDIRFDTTFFNTAFMTVPGSFFPDTVREISKEVNYDDDGHTHPNIQTRMDVSFEYLEGRSSLGSKKFVVSEEDFFHVRNLARFEGVNISLSEREYGKALYSIYLLKREFTENRFLDLSMVKALYGLAKYKNKFRFNEVTSKINKIEGESYKLHCFIKNLSKEQLNVVAFRHAYDMHKKYPGDQIFSDYMNDLKRELVINAKIDPTIFKKESYHDFKNKSIELLETFDIEDSLQKVEDSDLSKYDKIRIKKELKKLETSGATVFTDNDFHHYALHDIVKETDFLNELKKIKSEYDELIAQELLENQNRNTLNDKRGAHLGIKKVVIVDPIYQNYRLNKGRDHLKSEDKKITLSEMYTQDFSTLDIETDLIDSKNLQKSDVDEFNDLGLLMRWITEVTDHDEIDMISSCRDQMNDLTNKYGTSHFLFSGIYAYKQRNEPSAVHLYGVMFVYTIPLVVIDLLLVHNYFDFVALSVDASKDKIEFTESRNVNLKSINSIMKAYVYDVLYQLSSEPK